MPLRASIARRRVPVVIAAVVVAAAIGACRTAPATHGQPPRVGREKQRDTITRGMRAARVAAERRRIVDSVLAAVRTAPPPRAEPLLAVDDSVNAMQRVGAVALARFLAPEYRGCAGRSLEATIVSMVERADASRSTPFVTCARADTTDLARAQVVLRVGFPDTTGRRSLVRRDYVRRDGRWLLLATTSVDEAEDVPCGAPLPRPTLAF